MARSSALAGLIIASLALAGCGVTPGCRAVSTGALGAGTGAVVGAIVGAPIAMAAVIVVRRSNYRSGVIAESGLPGPSPVCTKVSTSASPPRKLTPRRHAGLDRPQRFGLRLRRFPVFARMAFRGSSRARPTLGPMPGFNGGKSSSGCGAGGSSFAKTDFSGSSRGANGKGSYSSACLRCSISARASSSVRSRVIAVVGVRPVPPRVAHPHAPAHGISE